MSLVPGRVTIPGVIAFMTIRLTRCMMPASSVGYPKSVNNMIMLTTIPEGLCIVGLAFGLLLGGIFILAATAGKGKRTG